MNAARIIFLLFLVCCVAPQAQADDLEEYYKNGVRLLDKNDYNGAIESFQKALQINPNVPQIYNLLGITYLKQEKSIESAIGSFQVAIRIDPNYAEAYYNLGVTYAGMGKNPALAAKYFEKAAELQPDFAKAYLGWGWISLFENKDPEKAASLFQKAIELYGDNVDPEAWYGLGMTYVVMGKKELALKPISMLRSLYRVDLASQLETMMQNQEEAAAAPASGDATLPTAGQPVTAEPPAVPVKT